METQGSVSRQRQGITVAETPELQLLDKLTTSRLHYRMQSDEWRSVGQFAPATALASVAQVYVCCHSWVERRLQKRRT